MSAFRHSQTRQLSRVSYRSGNRLGLIGNSCLCCDGKLKYVCWYFSLECLKGSCIELFNFKLNKLWLRFSASKMKNSLLIETLRGGKLPKSSVAKKFSRDWVTNFHAVCKLLARNSKHLSIFRATFYSVCWQCCQRDLFPIQTSKCLTAICFWYRSSIAMIFPHKFPFSSALHDVHNKLFIFQFC